jgi:hypothetical protein
MKTDIKLITKARSNFNELLFEPLKKHIIKFEKEEYYESAIWGAIFFEAFIFHIAEKKDINIGKKSVHLNSVIEELRKLNNQEKFIEDGYLKYFDSIRDTRNGLMHHTEINRNANSIKVDAENIHSKILEIVQWNLKDFDVTVKDDTEKIKTDLIPVFISTISPHTPEQVFFQEDFYYKLEQSGMKAIKVEFNDFDKKDPMSKVKDTINSCEATIVLGLERSHAYFMKTREGSEKESEETHIIHTSGWLHLEAGIAIASGQPLFILCQKNIIGEGIFDRDWNSYSVIEIEDLNSSSSTVDEFISHVKKELCKLYYYV